MSTLINVRVGYDRPLKAPIGALVMCGAPDLYSWNISALKKPHFVPFKNVGFLWGLYPSYFITQSLDYCLLKQYDHTMRREEGRQGMRGKAREGGRDEGWRKDGRERESGKKGGRIMYPLRTTLPSS